MGSNELSMVGLANKAGKTLLGTAACESGIRKGKLRLLLLQQGLSPSSIDRFRSLCEKNKVDVLIVSGYDGLGRAAGRPEIRVVGITDAGFAKKIKSMLVVGADEQ